MLITTILSTLNLAHAKNELSPKLWQEDIRFFVKELKQNHINLYHSVRSSKFNQEVDSLLNELPKLTNNQVLVALMKLTKSVNDGHTSFPLWGPVLHKFPIKLIALNEKLYVVESSSKSASLLGAELVAVNGHSIDDIKNAMAAIVPFSENKYSTAVRTAQYLTVAEVLNGLGFIDETYESQFTFSQKGLIKKLTFRTYERPQFDTKLAFNSPVADRKVFSASPEFWFSASKDKESVYIKFERYIDVTSMESFARKLLKFINEHSTKNLVIDMRNNYGGDFFAGLKLAQSLILADSLDWREGIYVLTNNVTFSAAMSNTAQFKQLLNAKIVGEPTGAKPKGYQDMGEFTLPNSQRVVTYSKRFYDFLGTDETTIYPDKVIELDIQHYLDNEDAQLNWVLERVNWL
jgi:hypothetical protein